MTRCTEGDSAFVLRAYVPANVGKVVRVLRRLYAQDMGGVLVYIVGPHTYRAGDMHGAVWLIESDGEPFTLRARGELVRLQQAPCPDRALWPIRGGAELDETHTWRCGSPGQMLAHAVGGSTGEQT